MKTNKTKLHTLLFAGALCAFTACKKDEEVGDITTSTPTGTSDEIAALIGSGVTEVTPSGTEEDGAQSRTTLDETSTSLTTELAGAADTETAESITALFTQFTSSESSGSRKSISTNAKKVEAFDPEPFSKVYGYQITLTKTRLGRNKLDTTSIGGTDVVLILPKDAERTKDIKLTLKAFKLIEIKTTDDLGNPISEAMPVHIAASVELDGSEVAKLSLAAKYNKEGSPIFADLDFNFDTFAINADYLDGTDHRKAELVLKNGSKVIIGGGVKIAYAAGSDKDNDDNIDRIAGYAQIEGIQLRGHMDAKGIRQYENATAEDLRTATEYNKHMNLTLVKVSNGNQLAKIAVRERDGLEGKEGYIALVFKDGEEKDAEVVFKKVFDQLQIEIDNLAGTAEETTTNTIGG